MKDTLPKTVDVVVLGGGIAGHCAAWAAEEAGAEVLLLEKNAVFGGSTACGPGSFAFAETQTQKNLGLNDSLALLRQDLIDAGQGRSREDLIDRYVELQLDTYQWMIKQGFTFTQVEASTYQTVPRSHPIDAGHVVRVLHDRLLEKPGFHYASNCRAQELVRNASGRVTGVRYEHDGHAGDVNARNGVVIATGGFSRSDRLIEKFAPEFSQAVRMGGRSNEGDGLLMAWALGADLLDTGYLSGTFGASLNNYPDISDRSGLDCFLMHPIFKGGIAVNKNAVRFADESRSYKATGGLCLLQPDGVAFQIFDQPIMDQTVPNMMPRNFRKAYELGRVKTASTIRALAATVGLDAETLEATVARYNNYVASGHDPDFGRTHQIGDIGPRVPLNTAPFYIYPCTTALLSTYGGIAVDTDMRVVDVMGQAIEGLYAAGEVAGGLHGAGYLSGSSLAKGAIFGRLAGAKTMQRTTI